MTAPLTVSKLTFQIKSLLESNFREILLQGEISNFKLQSSQHLYFSMKDDQAQISCVMFRGNTISLKQKPKDGDQVIVKGELSLYEPRGNYQIIVRELYFVGIGALLMQLEQLKAKLQKLGWFESARKKPIPKFPKRIGVVTSPTGAAIQDILNVLTRRYKGFNLILNPVKVQGEGAAHEIARAIYEMNHFELADVLIVGRGGGSLEDLWAFNEEIVAKAIFESKIPIISAVGHESDTTLSDLVADLRAPTPSAAAEIVMSEKRAQEEFLTKMRKHLIHTLTHLIKVARSELRSLIKHPVFSTSVALISRRAQRLDEIRSSLDLCITKKQAQFSKVRQKLLFYHKNFQLTFSHRLCLKKESIKGVVSELVALDPKNLLKKGYTILFSEKRSSLIISAKDVEQDDKLLAKLFDGEISLIAKNVKIKHE